MIENDIETYMLKQAKANGALFYKFISPQNAGIPDRILIFKGMVIFVELKAPGKKPRILQEKQHEIMQKHGATVIIIDDKESVDNVFKSLKQKKTRKPIDI